MKSNYIFLLFFCCIKLVEAQTLSDYLNLAAKKYQSNTNTSLTSTSNNTTSLQFGYFINPQYTISGAQRAYIEFQQEIPWLGKGNLQRKIRKNNITKIRLEKKQEIETLNFNLKACYYRMYQHKKQKDLYVDWAQNIREHIAFINSIDSVDIDRSISLFEYETQLIEITKKLQLVDGDYQNLVIEFNEYLRNETLDEPNLPLFLAMPEEESEFQFPDPFESASYLKFENELNEAHHIKSLQNPWIPSIRLGLRYVDVSDVNNEQIIFSNKDIIEPQLKLEWNLFSKKIPQPNNEETSFLLDHKLSLLSHQLQTAINNQISARIAYDAATSKIEKLNILKQQLNIKKNKINSAKILQLNSLDYSFKIEQVKAVADYYISTYKMLLFF